MQRAAVVSLAVCVSACTLGSAKPPDVVVWHAPADSEMPAPADSLGAAIRRGQALVLHTTDSLPRYAPGAINCTNCHLDGGRSWNAAPLVGAHTRFPKYMDRSGAVITLADRVNYCFTRSLAGNRLPTDSREMQDILAYIAWLSKDMSSTQAAKMPGAAGLVVIPTLTGDKASGQRIYGAKCVACHLPDGSGNANASPKIPALWGPRSFSVGASIARQSKAASFIWHNMPFGAPESLSRQEAWDVAAYVTSQPRPDSPGKEGDWPSGSAPADVPYATTSHVAYLPPPVLPRRNPETTLVPAPRSIRKQ